MCNCGMNEDEKFDGRNTFWGHLMHKVAKDKLKRHLQIDGSEYDKNLPNKKIKCNLVKSTLLSKG